MSEEIHLTNDDVVKSIGVAIKEKKYKVACNLLLGLNNWRIDNGLKPYLLSDIFLLNLDILLENEKPVNSKSVYVINFDDKTVKIGVSKNPEKRVKTLSNASGKKIIEYWYSEQTESAYQIERKTHKFFSKKRLQGEYFKVDYMKAIEIVKNEMAMIE